MSNHDKCHNLISGYWVDDGTEFERYITTANHDGYPKNIDMLDDDSIFFYGIDRESIDRAIETKNPINGEFVITSVESFEFI